MSLGEHDHAGPPPAHLVGRLKVVFLRTWDLGLTSFGGPPVHFHIYHRRFVEKHKWIDEQTVRTHDPKIK